MAADKLVTVSQAYAMEALQLPQQQGLELLLAEQKERLVRQRRWCWVLLLWLPPGLLPGPSAPLGWAACQPPPKRAGSPSMPLS